MSFKKFWKDVWEEYTDIFNAKAVALLLLYSTALLIIVATAFFIYFLIMKVGL